MFVLLAFVFSDLETRILPNPVVMQVYVLTDYVHTRYFKNDTAAHVRYVCLLMNTVSETLSVTSPVDFYFTYAQTLRAPTSLPS